MTRTQRILAGTGAVVLLLLLLWAVFAVGRASAPAVEKKQEDVAKTTAPASAPAVAPAAPAAPAAQAATACPPQFESCAPKKTDAQLVAEAIDRLGGRLAATPAPAAPKARRQVAAAPVPAPAGEARKVQISCEAAGLKEISLPVTDSRCKRLPNGVIRCPNVCG